MSELLINELKAQRNAAMDANAELRVKTIELSTLVGSLQQVIAGQSASLSKLNEEVNAAKAEVAELQAQLQAATASNQRKKKASNAGAS